MLNSMKLLSKLPSHLKSLSSHSTLEGFLACIFIGEGTSENVNIEAGGLPSHSAISELSFVHLI